MPGYHLREIPRGVFGEYSKVEEEFEEFLDALEQDCHLMALQELSDYLSASYQYYKNNWNSDITNLIKINADRTDIGLMDVYKHSDNKTLISLFKWNYEYASLDVFLYCIDSYCRRFNMTLNDLWKMSNITRRAFDEGYRTAK